MNEKRKKKSEHEEKKKGRFVKQCAFNRGRKRRKAKQE